VISPRPRAKKRFGQHFLESVWAEKVVRAINPRPMETFLEIGPGPGVLTRPLAARSAQVLAFEIDRDLVVDLRQVAIPRVELVEGDFLESTAASIQHTLSRLTPPIEPLRVAGNLPYNVASPILFKLIDLVAEGIPIVDASVMLQREVANRLLAVPGTKDYGVLTILIRLHARVDRLLQLPAGAFRPAPKVQSTVVRLTFHPPAAPVKDLALFRGLTQAIFTRRRKTLANALRAHPAAAESVPQLLAVTQIDGQRRPETLTLEELAGLANAVSALRA
jgi:16S rRNA (adenine1518-N6/adenine1519-N6)-dimethyltransferase